MFYYFCTKISVQKWKDNKAVQFKDMKDPKSEQNCLDFGHLCLKSQTEHVQFGPMFIKARTSEIGTC